MNKMEIELNFYTHVKNTNLHNLCISKLYGTASNYTKKLETLHLYLLVVGHPNGNQFGGLYILAPYSVTNVVRITTILSSNAINSISTAGTTISIETNEALSMYFIDLGAMT